MRDLELSEAYRDATLSRARQQRARQILHYSNGMVAWRRLAPPVSPDLGLWLTFAAIGVVWAAASGRLSEHGMAVMVAIWLASLVSSIAGFAFSAVCGAILFHLHGDTVQIVQIMIICSIANQAAMTWKSRGDIDWHGLLVYFAGGAPGLAIGVWILLHVNRGLYTQAFGVFLLAYGAWMLLRKPMIMRHQPAAADFIAGFLGGITGGAAGFPGAFVTIWCGMKGWDKARQRAVFQPFILVMQIAALSIISLARASGAGGVGFGPLDLLFVPASLIGTSLGLALYARMSDRQFARAVNILLVVSGLSYVM